MLFVATLYFLACLAITLWFVSTYEPGAPHKECVDDGYKPPGPFMRLDTPPGLLEIFKTTIMTMLLPLRLVPILAVLIGVWALLRLLMLGVSDLTVPMAKWRRDLCIFLLKNGAKVELILMGFWQSITYDDAAQEQDGGDATVIVSNHVSWLDILVCISVFGNTFIAKAATQKVPFTGFMAQAAQACFVSSATRQGKQSGDKKPAMSTTDKIMARQNNPQDWNKLLVFPEGTTTNGAYVVPFRSGAFVAGQPVQPITIHYPCRNFHLAYDCIYGAYHVFRVLTQVYNRVNVHVLPVYRPNADEKRNPKRYAANVGSLVAESLDVPESTNTFSDKLTYLKYLRGDDEKRVPRG